MESFNSNTLRNRDPKQILIAFILVLVLITCANFIFFGYSGIYADRSVNITSYLVGKNGTKSFASRV